MHDAQRFRCVRRPCSKVERIDALKGAPNIQSVGSIIYRSSVMFE